MRTPGVGNRPLSKGKKCKSWGLTRGKKLNHALLMMNTINLCLPDFFHILPRYSHYKSLLFQTENLPARRHQDFIKVSR